tara:strand:- start:1816 stop:5178 length:3363 start_codon:yes stop_codon:yes gene_type:complete
MEKKNIVNIQMPKKKSNKYKELNKISNKTLNLLTKIKSKIDGRTFNKYIKDISNIYKPNYKTIIQKIKNDLEIINEAPKDVILQTKARAKKLTSNLINTLTNVYNYDGKTNIEINMKSKTLNEKKRHLEILLRTFGTNAQRGILKIGNTSYTLNDKTKERLLNNLDNLWIEEGEQTISDEELINSIKHNHNLIITNLKNFEKPKLEGGFFRYKNITDIDLLKYMIFTENQEAHYFLDDNCLVYALIQSKQFNSKEIEKIRTIVKGKYIKTKDLKILCEKMNITFIVNIFPIKTLSQYKYGKGEKIINLGLIDNHYFLNEEIPYTYYAIQNYHQIKEIEEWNNIYRKDGRKILNRNTTSFKAIKYMFENKDKYFKLLSFNDITRTQYHNEAKITTLEYDDKDCVEIEYKPDENKKNNLNSDNSIIVFFDVETLTDEAIHIPFILCSSETESFTGEKCGLYFLNCLYEKFGDTGKTIVLIAHNASYDVRHLYEFLNIKDEISRGNKLLSMKATFTYKYQKGKNLNLIIKDSYALIPKKLKAFSKMFKIDVEKDIMPYNLYTRERINKRWINLDIIKKCCDKQVECNILNRIIKQEDYDEYYNLFLENCKIANCFITKNSVDIIKYAEYYCKKDVEVLKKGYNKFRELTLDDTGIDILNCMSSSQLANKYYIKEGACEGVYKLSGIPKQYIMKCMVGGRVMTRDNLKWNIKKILDDFDAVSLYPSAMKEMKGFLKGKPKILQSNQLNMEFLNKCDGYFIQIKVNKINKKRHFPLMSNINEDGIRNFTNNITTNQYVCKFSLEDLIEFQDIEFDIIDGYYYDEGRNPKEAEITEFLFNRRKELKDQDNPLQEIYKLIMNGYYGKQLQKDFFTKTHFLKGQESYDKFMSKYYNSILKMTELSNHNSNSKNKQFRMETEVGICESYNNCHIGVEILAMSKRLMNRVMCLAEDLDIEIYYQDTDSMHIVRNQLPLLEKEFYNKYNKNLIGKKLGQFHSDFDSDILKNKGKGTIYSSHGIFLGKKAYVDKLEKEGCDDEIYHSRMKGVNIESMEYLNRKNNTNMIDIYTDLFNKKSIKFDLACEGNKCVMDFNKNFSITTKNEFIREVEFKGKGITLNENQAPPIETY